MEYRSQFKAFRDVASLINSGGDLDAILHKLVYAACHHGIWSMGGIMGIDRGTGLAHVIVRHDPTLLENATLDAWALSASPTLVAVTRNEPVVIRDAQVCDAWPGYRLDAIERGYRTVVVLPIGRSDPEGRALVLSLQSRRVVDVSEDDLAVLETIVHLGAIAIDKAQRLAGERAVAERLQVTLNAQSALMRQVLSDGSVASVAAMIDALLPHPLVVVDLGAHLVVPGRSPRPDIVADEAWRRVLRGEAARQIVQACRAAPGGGGPREMRLPLAGTVLTLQARIEKLLVDDEAVGALVLFAPGPVVGHGDLDEVDPLMLDSVKFALSVQMMRSHIRFQSEQQTLSDLFTDIVEHRWRERDDIVARGRRLGLDLGAPARLVAIGFPGGGLDFHRSTERIVRRHGADAAVAVLGDVTIARLPVEAGKSEAALKDLVRKIADEARFVLGQAPIVAVSKPCERLEDHPAAWEECTRILRLARRFDRRGLVMAHDFGPFPALLSSADTREVRAFIEGTIGAMLRQDREEGTRTLETLSRFLDLGCRHQACADALGIHVTTLRYRLQRIQEFFGIDIDTPERRFAVELAIRLHGALADDRKD